MRAYILAAVLGLLVGVTIGSLLHFAEAEGVHQVRLFGIGRVSLWLEIEREF
jgi:hypothetical protein